MIAPASLPSLANGTRSRASSSLARKVHHRRAVVRIAGAEADAGEVFQAGGGAGLVQAADERAGELDDGLGIAAEGAALQTFRRIVAADVDDRREIDLDVEVAQRHADDASAPARHLGRLGAFGECLHARQAGDEMAEAVDAASLFIDHEERRRGRRERFDLGGQLAELVRLADVAAEDDDGVRRVVREGCGVRDR